MTVGVDRVDPKRGSGRSNPTPTIAWSDTRGFPERSAGNFVSTGFVTRRLYHSPLAKPAVLLPASACRDHSPPGNPHAPTIVGNGLTKLKTALLPSLCGSICERTANSDDQAAGTFITVGRACVPESSGKTSTESRYPPDAVAAGDMRDAIELSTKCARSTQWTRAGNSDAFRRMSAASRADSDRYKSHSRCRLSRRCSRRADQKRK